MPGAAYLDEWRMTEFNVVYNPASAENAGDFVTVGPGFQIPTELASGDGTSLLLLDRSGAPSTGGAPPAFPWLPPSADNIYAYSVVAPKITFDRGFWHGAVRMRFRRYHVFENATEVYTNARNIFLEPFAGVQDSGFGSANANAPQTYYSCLLVITSNGDVFSQFRARSFKVVEEGTVYANVLAAPFEHTDYAVTEGDWLNMEFQWEFSPEGSTAPNISLRLYLGTAEDFSDFELVRILCRPYTFPNVALSETVAVAPGSFAAPVGEGIMLWSGHLPISHLSVRAPGILDGQIVATIEQWEPPTFSPTLIIAETWNFPAIAATIYTELWNDLVDIDAQIYEELWEPADINATIYTELWES